ARLVFHQRIGPPVRHVAEGAATGADITHDHEGRGAAAEAFAQVGTGCFLADRTELVAAQGLLDAFHALAAAKTHADPLRLAGQFHSGNDLHGNARDLVGTAQLLALHNFAGHLGIVGSHVGSGGLGPDYTKRASRASTTLSSASR